MQTRIKKVKLTKDEKIHIVFEKRAKNREGWDEYSITCSDQPRPEFYIGIQGLAIHVAEMCELPEDYVDRIQVRGVSFSYGGEKEVMGATITAQMELHNSNCPLNLNTPHKASESYSDTPADPVQLLTDECVDALFVLCNECDLYIGGERAQGQLFKVS